MGIMILCTALSCFIVGVGNEFMLGLSTTLSGFIDFLLVGFLLAGCFFILEKSIKPYCGPTKEDIDLDISKQNDTTLETSHGRQED